MANNYYDYIIETVTNPAFSDNVDLMIVNGLVAGGTSPTIKIETVLDETDPNDIIPITKPIQHPMIGTKEVTGRIMLHFRLPSFMSEGDLIIMLEGGMSNPKPPISVESIRSATKNIYVDDGLDIDGLPIGHYEYDVVVTAKRVSFLKYMEDGVDEGGNPNGTINEYLSVYYGSDPILLN